MAARRKRKSSKKTRVDCSFSDDKIEAMRRKARELSKMIGQNSNTCVGGSPSGQNVSRVNVDRLPAVLANDKNPCIPSCSKSSAVEETSCSDTVTSPQVTTSPGEHVNLKSKRKSTEDLNANCKNAKIPYLVKCDVYREEHVDDLTSKKQDDYVLEKLFNKSGMCLDWKYPVHDTGAYLRGRGQLGH